MTVNVQTVIRAWLAIFAWGIILLLLGIPVLVTGLVYPSYRLIAWASAFWARVMLAICGVRLTIRGRENVTDDQPKFFMGNHQSALDIPIIIAALKGNVRFLAKNTLFRYPIFGWILWRYGYVSVDRIRARTTLIRLNRMLERIRERPVSIAVFPEGTRTYDGKLLPFRKGTMKICRRSGLPAVPFAIDGSYLVNPRERLRAYPGAVRLSFGKVIPPEEVAAMSATELHDRVRGAVQEMLGHKPTIAREATRAAATEGAKVDQQRDFTTAAHP